LGERLLCKQEVIGSIPFTSTIRSPGSATGRVAGSGGRRPDVWLTGIWRRPGWSRVRPGGVVRWRPGPGRVLIDRVKRICECDRGGRARDAGVSLWRDRPEQCLHVRRRERGAGRRQGSRGLPPGNRLQHRAGPVADGVCRCARRFFRSVLAGCPVGGPAITLLDRAKTRASGGCLGTERR
jgi:hypothetical protein